MKAQKLHRDEVPIDARLIRRLLKSQFNRWAELPLSPAVPFGTSNVIYRIGENLCARLPRRPSAARSLEKELEWLPFLSSQLSIKTPRPIARGEPDGKYPFTWAIYEWLEGEIFDAEKMGNRTDVAESLARFVADLRSIDAEDAPESGRCRAPGIDDAGILETIESLRAGVDGLTAILEESVRTPASQENKVWTHGDLLPTNILVRDQQVAAVIDFGLAGAGDPAVDMIPAWSTLRGEARRVFRSALDIDNASWTRARGFALRQALRIIPYYRETNPGFYRMAHRTVEEIFIDSARGRRK